MVRKTGKSTKIPSTDDRKNKTPKTPTSVKLEREKLKEKEAIENLIKKGFISPFLCRHV